MLGLAGDVKTLEMTHFLVHALRTDDVVAMFAVWTHWVASKLLI